ncbi:MAG: transketolase C-terminal domain-containing protein [Erysipelotrichaceae bacterium]
MIRDDITKIGREQRISVVETLQELMDKDINVVALEADLGGASGFTKIVKSHPQQFIQVGIAEANMIGIAAGMSSLGYKPFVHTFGPFATRRVFDQIFISGAYAHNTINIYGSDPGFCAGPNGGTHTTFEDVALMRTIPSAIVCDGADDTQLSFIIKEFSKLEGIHYVRANRKGVRDIYTKDTKFTLGKGIICKEGRDVLVITSGQILADALDCAYELEKEGISVEVIDMFTIKPLDKELVLSEIKNKSVVVTFENHSIIGGLGSAISEVIAENGISTKFKRHGIDERFGQVGTQEFLQKEFRLTCVDLKKTIKELL